MKVGLNATCLNDRPSGAKQRFVGIYRELFALAPEIEFVIYEPSDCEVAKWFAPAANVSAIKTPIPSEGRVAKALHGLGYWRTELARQTFDVFEGFNLPMVVAPGAINLMTLHDLRGLRPEAGIVERMAFRWVLRRAIRSVSRVVTVSEAMKRALLDFDADAKVSVVYNGLADHSGISNADLDAFKLKFGLDQGFILAVGHFESRKNYPRLVDAVATLGQNGLSPSLVIIGNDSGERVQVEASISATGLEGRVYLLSGLSDVEVQCAYALCGLFVFPSSYEGFGIPILEAMAAGRPMVLSDIPVFREITQGRGIYFPPLDPDAMAAAMQRVLTQTEMRTGLVDYGHVRVRDFSYGRLAEQVLSMYRSTDVR